MTSHSFLSLGNQFLTEPAWGQTPHWSDQCPFCWPKPGSTRNEMSVRVDHGDKPQRYRRVVQHTGREGRKFKKRKLTLLPGALETQSSFPSWYPLMAFDCVSDGGAEPAGGDQHSATAVLPEGDHWAETHHECSGGWTAGPAPNGTWNSDQAQHSSGGNSPWHLCGAVLPNVCP